MRIVFHPEFPRDQVKFQADYGEISTGLAERFRGEIDQAISEIKASPSAAGHFVNTGSKIVPELRRRNLNAFPFFHPLRLDRRAAGFWLNYSHEIGSA